MLNMNILNSNIEQKCPAKPEVYYIGMQTHVCTTTSSLKIQEKDSIIKKTLQTRDWSCLLQSYWIECFSCIVDLARLGREQTLLW